MLIIRLQRIGKKHQPSYRIVVAERRSKLGGPPAEDVGSYNPFTKRVTLEKERIEHWLKVGAKPTVTVHNLFVEHGAITGAKVPKKIRAAKKKEETQAGTTPPAPAAGAATE